MKGEILKCDVMHVLHCLDSYKAWGVGDVMCNTVEMLLPQVFVIMAITSTLRLSEHRPQWLNNSNRERLDF